MAGIGRYFASGARNITRPSSASAEKTAASGVLAPAAKLSPLRLNEPLDGYPEKKLPRRFDRPWPMNSWLPSMRCSAFTAMARAIDTASVSASSATATAIGSSCSMRPGERSGIDSGGRPIESAPMLAMPVADSPKTRFSASARRLPASIAAIMCGTRGIQRRVATLASTVATATAVTQGFTRSSWVSSPPSTSSAGAPRGWAGRRSS